MNTETFINFTETKNGHATGNTFSNTAGDYIQVVRNASPGADHFTNLYQWEEVGSGDDAEFVVVHDGFYDLPIEQQLDLCIRVNDDSYASHTTYEVAE